MNQETCVPVIILNWNRSDLTISLVKNISNVENEVALRFIVVDNASSSEYRNMLIEFANINNWSIATETELQDSCLKTNQHILLLLDKNYGYAKGNNFGLKLARKLGYKCALISNNDVVVEKPVLKRLILAFNELESIAVVGPRIYGPNGERQGPYSKPNLYHYFFYPVFIPILWPMKKLVKKILSKKSISKKDEGTTRYCYRLTGCFMLMDLDVIEKVGWFDENTFLYAEEDILAEKLERVGYKMAYVDSVYIKHMHGQSTQKLGNKSRLLQQLNAELYYFRRYRGYGPIKLALVKAGFIYSNFFLHPVVSKIRGFIKKL